MADRKPDALRGVWLGSHLLDDAEGAAAHAASEALGAAVHARHLQVGDRLAAASAVLAQRYYKRAAAAWSAFGADGFDRWVALGERLADGEPQCRDGAMAYFGLAPASFGRDGLVTADAWCALGRELAATSSKLAAIFFRTTGSLLRRADGLARLRHWAEIGLGLHGHQGWQGEFLAQAFFAAAPHAVTLLDPAAYRLWAGAGAAVYPTVKERDFFGQLPKALKGWAADEQADYLRTVIALAQTAVKEAAALYRELPDSLASLEPPVRAALLRAFRQTGKRLAGAAADVAPVAGPLVLQVPAAQRLDALEHLGRVAAACPNAMAAALRSLPRVYEEAAPAMVREWFDAGLELARDNADAGMAFFALESRTSLKVLRASSIAATLDELQGLLRKYVQMLSGEAASLRSYDYVRLRPPLEEFPAENELALPLRIDWLPTHEENQRLYRFLAAQLAGRREFGTYEFMPPGMPIDDELPPGGALYRYVNDPERPESLEELLLLAEGMRIHHRLCGEYRGLAAEGRWVAERLLERWTAQPAPPRTGRLDAVLMLALRGPGGPTPRWLDEPGARLIVECLAPLAAPSATIADSLAVAESLATALAAAQPAYVASDRDLDGFAFEQMGGDALLDMYGDDEGPPPAPTGEAPRVDSTPSNEKHVAEERLPLQLAPDEMEGAGGSAPMSPEELKRLLDSGAKLKITQATGEEVDGIGLFITDLIGKLPSEQIDELRNLVGDPDSGQRRVTRRLPGEDGDGSYFAYDEWDYHIDDYRSAWCRLYELNIDGDSGEFFTQALGDYARLIPEVRRQFQRVRPEMYRTVRGLEDGEDFDLNAAIAARVDRRAGLAPSSRLYVARKREERDVATLFLVDMSASTDEPFDAAGGGSRSAGRGRRIIDVTKETLVIMSEALEEIGDAYAIYGFSGHGRERVEMYRVKSFAEALTTTVKGRLGGIEPKRSTRMGTALRHAVEKLSAVSSRVKHLFLLSDGFPQDYDYGQDRRSNVYGIRDTAAALREAEAAGVTPFCITVDKAGHDYLRQMCDESRYMVIEDITALPRELPKIYQRVVRA